MHIFIHYGTSNKTLRNKYLFHINTYILKSYKSIVHPKRMKTHIDKCLLTLFACWKGGMTIITNFSKSTVADIREHSSAQICLFLKSVKIGIRGKNNVYGTCIKISSLGPKPGGGALCPNHSCMLRCYSVHSFSFNQWLWWNFTSRLEKVG